MDKLNMLRLGLQFFGSGSDGNSGDAANSQNENNDGKEDSETLYTEQQVAQLVSERVSAELKKLKLDADDRVSEAEKLAKMSESERKDYEISKLQRKVSEMERDKIMDDNRITCINVLSGKGLPASLAEFVVCEDAEQMNRRINALDSVIKAAVNDEVSKRIGKSAPKSGESSVALTREQFRAMSIVEQQEIFNNNRALYDSMIN